MHVRDLCIQRYLSCAKAHFRPQSISIHTINYYCQALNIRVDKFNSLWTIDNKYSMRFFRRFPRRVILHTSSHLHVPCSIHSETKIAFSDRLPMIAALDSNVKLKCISMCVMNTSERNGVWRMSIPNKMRQRVLKELIFVLLSFIIYWFHPKACCLIFKHLNIIV